MSKDECKIVVCSGYFDPLMPHHLDMFRDAKKHGDILYVIVNNDEQVKLKGSIPFLTQGERRRIVNEIEGVAIALISLDTDRSVAKSLERIWPDIFYNGGDVTDESKLHPAELEVCKRLGIKMVFGGQKTGSSSEVKQRILKWHYCQLETPCVN
jgi:D-glycero-beta-D-manno-heptose 1-phosphate adenylyltransferase